MWFESQNCAMMGLQATTGKRKLEAATAPAESSPPKNGRWEAEDCIARLQAVAVPSDTWRSPTLAATLLSTTTSTTTTTTSLGCVGSGVGNSSGNCSSGDDYEDDDEFDDELSDDDRCSIIPEPARFTSIINNNNNNNNNSNNNNNNNNSNNNNSNNNGRYNHQSDYWQYYQPPQQQTIRCEENGKSYLELGASPPSPAIRNSVVRCCDGRTRWCHVPCYRQRRLAVLNLSMCKLARYRQCSDPSLRRSVLICNTLRRLEREMESEPLEPNYTLPEMSPPSRPSPVVQETTTTTTAAYEQSLREMTCQSGRATPFPSNLSDNDSGLGDDEMTRPINWGSVLSLSSQTDLESLNNNELYAELGLSSDTWKEPSTSTRMSTDNDWDGFMHVLVGGT